MLENMEVRSNSDWKKNITNRISKSYEYVLSYPYEVKKINLYWRGNVCLLIFETTEQILTIFGVTILKADLIQFRISWFNVCIILHENQT
jgi:hypothetical protein